MIDGVYSICKRYIYVFCNIDAYSERLRNWLKPFAKVNSDMYDAFIKIEKNKTTWSINDKTYVINKCLDHTDLYPLFYNIVANLLLQDNKLLIHSSVLSLNDFGILVLGDFNSGKTTLSLEAKNKGFKILSSDQSFLEFKKNKLYLVSGSTFVRNRDDDNIFINESSEAEIIMIINLVGLSNNGDLVIDSVNESNYIIKNIFKHLTWHSDIPLFSDDIILDIDKIKIKKILSKFKIPFYNIRGDKVKVVEKIKELLK